jgi:serine/threonine-protein kinase|tara:strand:- start:409 stop:2697 length:2289 start_codon:yes stop_codon:yes gene_type:complete
MSAEVFVSYSSQDFEEVHRIVEQLRGAGVSVWMDDGGIEAATLWSEAIVEAINDSKVLIMMVSSHSTDSPNVVKEVMLSSESGKVILPVYLEEAEIPSRLKYQLTGIQHLEVFSLSESGLIEELLRGLSINGVTVPGIKTTNIAASTKLPSHRRKKNRRSNLLFPLAASCALGLLIGWFFSGASSKPQDSAPMTVVINASINLPNNAPLADTSVMWGGVSVPHLAVASNGSFFVYAAKNGTSTILYKRSLGLETVEPISGTEGGFAPFLSPDNQWVAFIAENKLKKVSLNGGSPQILAEATNSMGGTWADNGIIFFTIREGGVINSISEKGGESKLVEVKSHLQAEGHPGALWPHALPGGRQLLVTSQNNPQKRYSIHLLDVETGVSRQLVFDGGCAHYLDSGHIVYGRKSDLYSTGFNLGSLELVGDEQLVQEGVRSAGRYAGQFTVARENGTLVYLPGEFGGAGQLTWVDRNGNEESLGFKERVFGTFNLSPKGDKLLAQVWEPTASVWMFDLETKLESVVEQSPSNGFKGFPRWHTDGEGFTFSSTSGELYELFSRRLAKPNHSKLIEGSPDTMKIEGSWSPDGKRYVYNHFSEKTKWDLSIFDKETGRHEGLMVSEKTEWGPRISPDGKWVTFTMDKTGGTYEVFVISIDGGMPQQVSLDNGVESVWMADGTELIYRERQKLVGRKLESSSPLSFGPPGVIYEGDFLTIPGHSYDVSPDGDRFLVLKEVHPQGESLELNIITQWSSKFANTAARRVQN